KGACNVTRLIKIIEDGKDDRISDVAREVLCCLVDQLRQTDARIVGLERKLKAWHRTNEASQRLATIPGIGMITATALVATVGDASQFRSGSQLAAWLGLVPRQFSTGGKIRLGRITKHGDGYLRRLLVHGARAALRWSRRTETIVATDRYGQWQQALLARRPTNIVLVAMANKMARIAWALLTRGDSYKPQGVMAAA
ncbi:MAG: IS110 family transposase, partial [Hyphomicrobiales bacterium]|nr:IS110 family transposase [Hyphomicrobiales bacterium]